MKVCFRIMLISLILVFSTVAKSKCQLIINVNGYTPTAESDALVKFNWLAFEHGKVTATGSKNQPAQLSNCQQIDGQGFTLLPGLIDAHGHISGLGNQMQIVQLRGIESESVAAEKVNQFAESNQHNQWILGRGWNQVLWLGQQFPTKASLDQLTSKKPIFLTRVDGHAAWVNSKALKIAGIDRSTPDPIGGKILRDAKGDATGILIDNAIELVRAKIPAPEKLEREAALDQAFAHLLSLGIVSVHDAGIEQNDIDSYLQRSQNHQLPLRIYAMLSGESKQLETWLNQGIHLDAEEFLSIRSVKLFSDGALGSRGAAMLEAYSDDPDNKGLLLHQSENLQHLIELILSKGFQVNVHAIGDRGNRLVLDLFESGYKKVGGQKLRNRIEHAQVISLTDIPRLKTLKMIASMQPVHATSDMNMAGDRIGNERLKGAYAWQTLLKQGTVIASGSDFPVELANPFHGLHAAVTRQNHQNHPENGWLADQKMTISQALKSFTLNAAYAAHQEKTMGSLEAGKWADFILIDRDIIHGDPQNIWKTLVLQTWIAGELKYSKNLNWSPSIN